MEKTVVLPIQSETQSDILIVGGGPAGCCAALAAARQGWNTILMDECGMLGGLASLGMVAPISATKDRRGESFGGIMQEVLDKMHAFCTDGERPGAEHSMPSLLGLTLLDMLHKAGVQVHFFTKLVSVERSGRKLTGVIAATKSGLRRYCAKQFIDASGDGDLFANAGEESVFGSEPGVYDRLIEAGLGRLHFDHSKYACPAPGAVQPSSVMFTVGGVKEGSYAQYNNKRFTYADFGITREDFEKLPYANQVGFEENGDYLPLPQGRFLIFQGARPGEFIINMSRVTEINGADADSLNQGTLDAELQILPILDLLRRLIPGFEHAYLIQPSARLGVRESRRLVSRRVLHGEEAINCVPMQDVIAHGSYIIDIHDPKGKSMALGGPVRCSAYDIPYGALVPKGADNLLVCGRCIGVDHVAHSTTRIIGTCMLTGQAAGTAAAMCIRDNVEDAGALNVSALQHRLIADGVRLHIPGENDRSPEIIPDKEI